MRTLPAALETQLDATGMRGLIPLVSIAAVPQNESKLATPIYRTSWSQPVTFDGITYTPDLVRFSEVKQTLEAERPGFRLFIQNARDPLTGATRPWSILLDDDDDTQLNGCEVILRTVHVLHLADPTAVITEKRWYISGWKLNDWLESHVGPPVDALAVKVPRFPIIGNVCGWKYKKGPCTSESTLPECTKLGLVECARHFPPGADLPMGPSQAFHTKDSRTQRVGVGA